MYDKRLKTEQWTPEQIAEHCKKIGADGPPPKKGYVDAQITGSQVGFNGRYIKKGGASW
ncbi:hypothetical protein [Paenibacillus anaericanus]|uniref:hypothetical protein n=1 Tax=Paenibacillus anaericanus TaxID=170367 RepID=UPI001477750F|nr:hypothetical protein [Paenibacillus anaericanus]